MGAWIEVDIRCFAVDPAQRVVSLRDAALGCPGDAARWDHEVIEEVGLGRTLKAYLIPPLP